MIELSTAVCGGRGWPFASPPYDVANHGAVMEEFIVRGEARACELHERALSVDDGRWDSAPGESAAFVTRLYVVRPRDAARFNGIVLLHWLNVTPGVDLGYPPSELLDQGYAWVGLTNEPVALSGRALVMWGAMPSTIGHGLVDWDPARYGELRHPGAAHAYDVFARVGRRIRAATGVGEPLAGLTVRRLIASGLSQSAMRLGSYVNLWHAHEPVFDAYYLLGHWGMCPTLPDPTTEACFTPIGNGRCRGTSRIRDDLGVPILVLNSEGETLFMHAARQPDSATFRHWEVAGTSHSTCMDTIEANLTRLRDGLAPVEIPADRNATPWGYVRTAALRDLVAWTDGIAPPSFSPIEVADGRWPTIRRDELGHARGGIRVPELEAPTAKLTATRRGRPIDGYFGQATPMSEEELRARYGSTGDFLDRWDEAVDAIERAHILRGDEARAERERGRTIARDRIPF